MLRWRAVREQQDTRLRLAERRRPRPTADPPYPSFHRSRWPRPSPKAPRLPIWSRSRRVSPSHSRFVLPKIRSIATPQASCSPSEITRPPGIIQDLTRRLGLRYVGGSSDRRTGILGGFVSRRVIRATLRELPDQPDDAPRGVLLQPEMEKTPLPAASSTIPSEPEVRTSRISVDQTKAQTCRRSARSPNTCIAHAAGTRSEPGPARSAASESNPSSLSGVAPRFRPEDSLACASCWSDSVDPGGRVAQCKRAALSRTALVPAGSPATVRIQAANASSSTLRPLMTTTTIALAR